MQLVILDSVQAIAQWTADETEVLLEGEPAAVLGTATGSSPLLLYDEPTARCTAGRLDFAEVTEFMPGECADLPAGHPERYATFMEINLRSRVDVRPDTLHSPDALSEDLEATCWGYEAQTAQARYCDLQIPGIGSDGHIGFNEPDGALDSHTRLGELHGQTRRNDARFFSSDVGAVPTQYIIWGLTTVIETRKLVLIATDEGKAEAIAQFVEGETSAQWSATVIQCHDDTLVLADPVAASRLTSTH